MCLILRDFSTFSPCCLSSLLSSCFSPGHQLLFPRCGGQISCALLLMRTLAPLPSTTLSHVTSPTTTTSRRPLNHTSRNPPAENGSLNSHDLEYEDYTSAWRSLHHCSPQEREDDASRRRVYHSHDEGLSSVSRRLSVIERGDPLWNSLTHKFQTSEKIRAAAQKMSKSGFF